MEARDQKARVVNLHDHAAENLKFIRDTMASATTFTGVTGKGLVFCGFTALVTSAVAWGKEPWTWLGIWSAALLVAGPVAFLFMARKAAAHGQSLVEGTGRKLLIAFLPALALGGVVTLTAVQGGDFKSLPGLWLALYGLGVTSAGAWSVKAVPLFGCVLLLLGCVTLLTPVNGDLMMAAGFGVLHVGFGTYIWRIHGG